MSRAPSGRQQRPNLNDLVAEIYEVGANRAHWSLLLEMLCDLERAQVAMLASHSFSARTGRIHHSRNISGDFLGTYADRDACDAWASRMIEAGALGTILIEDASEAMQPAAAALYAEWLRPQGIRYLLRAVIGQKGPDTPCGPEITYLAMGRKAAAGPFDDEDIARLESIMPHLRRVMRICAVMDKLKAKQDALAFALNRISIGIVFLDSRGQIFAMNKHAQEIIAQNSGSALSLAHLLCRGDRHPVRPSTTGYRNGGAAATWLAEGHAVAVLSRASGLPPMIATMLHRESTREGDGVEEPPFVLFLSDPRRKVELDEKTLRPLFGLTPAEARLAAHLARGAHLDEAARQLGISIHTVRTHLKRVLGKTNTDCQADLLRLLLNSCTQIRG